LGAACRLGEQAMCQSGHHPIGGHVVEVGSERSAYISHAPLGLRFNGCLWFRRQL
jgi:hypothetical protein